ncbi:14163_t:CDS:2, partial [Cetraspora pellucida]
NYTAQSIHYRSIPQVIFENEYFDRERPSEMINAFNEDDYFKLMTTLKAAAVQSYLPYYKIYEQVAKEINADLFVCDYLINYPCFDLAWKLGKPAVVIFSDTFYVSSPPYKSNPIYRHGCHANMENESFYNRFKCEIIFPIRNSWNTIDTIKDLNAQRAIVGVDPLWNMIGRVSNLLILTNNFFGYEIPSANSPLHQEIGPILPDTFPGLTPVIDSFLSTHPRTIYFALGTNAIIPPQKAIIILKSFLKLINENVIDGLIWSYGKTDISKFPQLTNSSIPLSTILNNEHPHIHISESSPQFAILSHENTKVFLSHGGVASCHESMYTATPMLVLPIFGDQPRNAEKLEFAGIALKLSKMNLKVDDIVSKIKRLLNEESFKKNAERLQFLAKINSKRKYRGADLIEVVMNTVKFVGIEDEDGGFKIDNENLLRDWITPNTRMGFIRGKYLDVYSVAIILFLMLSGSFVYVLLKTVRYIYIKFRRGGNISSQASLKPKRE